MTQDGAVEHDDPIAIDPPATGRRFGDRRRVHLGDVTPGGRVRLDALARYLQDVSDLDTTDAQFPPDAPWVVRRAEVAVAQFPVFREWVELTTWCSGIGARWAERRVRLTGDGGGHVEAAVLWVHLDRSGRPARLPDDFGSYYAEAARGRTVRARLHHPTSVPDGAADVAGFPLRFTDFDVQGHVNNAVSWAMVEAVWSARPAPDAGAGVRVAVEHPGPIERDADPRLLANTVGDGFDLWATVDGAVVTSARLRPFGAA